MFKVKVGENAIPVPENWGEVTLDMYNRLTSWDGKDMNELLSKLTGHSAFVLVNTDLLSPIIERLTWLSKIPDTPELPDTVYVGGKSINYPRDISQDRFQCKIMMDKNLSDHAAQNLSVTEAMTFTLAAYLYEPFHGKPFSIHRIDDVNDFMTHTGAMSLLDALSIGGMYHDQGRDLTERWNLALTGGNYTNEQIRAGVKRFEKYGVWGMVHNLTGKLHMNREEIMQLPYQEVFLSLLYDKESAEYQTKLHQILNPKPKRTKR